MLIAVFHSLVVFFCICVAHQAFEDGFLCFLFFLYFWLVGSSVSVFAEIFNSNLQYSDKRVIILFKFRNYNNN